MPRYTPIRVTPEESRAIQAGALGVLEFIGDCANRETRRNKHTEDDFHESVVREIDKIWPAETSEVIWWSNENRFQGAIAGMRNKRRGIRSGVPDMIFLWRMKVVFLELKVPKNKAKRLQPSQVSDVQSALFARLHRQGFPAYPCLTLDHVFDALRAEHFPLPKGCCRGD